MDNMELLHWLRTLPESDYDKVMRLAQSLLIATPEMTAIRAVRLAKNMLESK